MYASAAVKNTVRQEDELNAVGILCTGSYLALINESLLKASSAALADWMWIILGAIHLRRSHRGVR